MRDFFFFFFFFFNFSEQGWGDFWQMALGKEAKTCQSGCNGIEIGRQQWCHESWSLNPSSHSEVFGGQNAQCESRSGGCLEELERVAALLHVPRN